MNHKKPMILSPAGSFESMHAAISGGCDAFYFGVEQLNMRARSTNNFTLSDLPQIAALAREKNVTCYLTLNTVLYDHDIRLMHQIVNACKEAGINAIIASDLAVISYCKNAGVPVHISTQANVSNFETLEFYSPFADVVVLARELTLSQVRAIAHEIERKKLKGPSGNLVKLEVFVHGALCMAVSGKCYLSLHSHYASANRGACVQNCRKSYIVTDKDDGNELLVDNEYIMSAKDLCTIDFLDKIADSGANVLKIEGRGRSPEYVYTVTKCYREAIDSIFNNTYSAEKITAWKSRLATVFNRGFWDGYYLGRTMGEWSDTYGSQATQKKIHIGKGLKYYDRSGSGEFVVEAHSLKAGEKILITGPTTGYLELVADELRVDGCPVDEVRRGDIFTVKTGGRIRASDKIYKLVGV
jgi:putative protease